MIKIEGEFICRLPKGVFAPDRQILRKDIEETYKDLASAFNIEYCWFKKINAKPFGSKGYLETIRRVQVTVDIEVITEYCNAAAVEITLFRTAKKLFPGCECFFTVLDISYGYKYNIDQDEIDRMKNPETDSYFLPKGTEEISIPNSMAYDELMKLIGLKKIKEIVNQLLAVVRINQLRKRFGYPATHNTLHMVFTGNPGTAKTTVARLLAQILVDKGVIRKTEMMECGRADLVGKYVGWTAKMIREKFAEAKGGMLFIDEAYSLTDNNDDYGNEAVATIVQEMENNREDTVVIFAGYKDKMAEFLSHNEGLSSRIAFQLDFPDYSEQELMEILELMLIRKCYVATEKAKSKCKEIIKDAQSLPFFGNGRYIRNLLERAVLRQAYRLDQKYKDSNPDQDELITLLPEDFERLETIDLLPWKDKISKKDNAIEAGKAIGN